MAILAPSRNRRLWRSRVERRWRFTSSSSSPFRAAVVDVVAIVVLAVVVVVVLVVVAPVPALAASGSALASFVPLSASRSLLRNLPHQFPRAALSACSFMSPPLPSERTKPRTSSIACFATDKSLSSSSSSSSSSSLVDETLQNGRKVTNGKSNNNKNNNDDDDNGGKNGENSSKIVIVAGATGYIGRAIVRESVQKGYDTVALVRDASYVLHTHEGRRLYGEPFEGARVVQADVEDAEMLADLFASFLELEGENADMEGRAMKTTTTAAVASMRRVDDDETTTTTTTATVTTKKTIDAVISCLASPSGTKKEAEAIDYRATLNCLNAGRDGRVNARHFVLLSAFCVRNPLLELQRQKLRFESELTSQTDMTYSIVRPTAFFKSVSGQLEGIQGGAPYVLFGDGAVTRCNPIAEEELAEYMLGCLDPDTGRTNRILNVGGPDEPLTNQMLGEMMYRSVGREAKFVYAPTWIFDYVIDGFQRVADWTGGDEWWEDAAETARIGKYYAVEDMLTTDPEEKYGTITMQQHYDRIAQKGQDPFTPVRATAVIARVLESLPAVSLSLPVGYAFLNPKVVETAMAPIVASTNHRPLDFSMILASIPHFN